MKIKIVLLGFLFFAIQLYGQTEFETYDSGLMYSEKTMTKLKHMVDSLNLKFKQCNFNKKYSAKRQSIGHVVYLDGSKVKQAQKDIQNKISFEDFVAKYPSAKIVENVVVVKSTFKNYQEETIVTWNEINLQNEDGLEISQENKNNLYEQSQKNSWLFKIQEKTRYTEETIQAFYFPEAFKSLTLNEKYNRQIGYADCLIDTTTTKLKDHINVGWIDLPNDWQRLSDQKKIILLEQMRTTKVVGGCSQDSRPRVHAMNIAVLAAETINWEIFLKSHLDIMNDRFERISDASYAYQQRKTYIKELEALDINVVDLVMGITLRIENPAQNHYFSRLGRLGRVIAESVFKEEFKKQILSLIADNELDNYNRILAYFVMVNVNKFTENKEEQQENIKLVKQAVATFPPYIKEKIKLTTE